MQPTVVSPKPEIIGEEAAIFTDMTETILDALDKQVVAPPGTQQVPIEKPYRRDQENINPSNGVRSKSNDQKEEYPDLFLPVRENH